jgi:hypothetical protein
MNAALRIEEPVEMIRVLPAPPMELKIESAFSVETFEVPIRCNSAAESRRSPDPDGATPIFSDVIVTSRLTATETLCVRKMLKPY